MFKAEGSNPSGFLEFVWIYTTSSTVKENIVNKPVHSINSRMCNHDLMKAGSPSLGLRSLNDN